MCYKKKKKGSKAREIPKNPSSVSIDGKEVFRAIHKAKHDISEEAQSKSNN
jgi:hypothetical protein